MTEKPEQLIGVCDVVSLQGGCPQCPQYLVCTNPIKRGIAESSIAVLEGLAAIETLNLLEKMFQKYNHCELTKKDCKACANCDGYPDSGYCWPSMVIASIDALHTPEGRERIRKELEEG